MVSSGLAIFQDESDSAELVGCRSTSHVSGLSDLSSGQHCFCRN